MKLRKERKAKKKINYFRLIWILGIYIILLIILYLVITFKVKYEG